MDHYKLLSRSTKLSKPTNKAAHCTPSSGPNAQPRLFSSKNFGHDSRKRKREIDTEPAEFDFFEPGKSHNRASATNLQKTSIAEASETDAESAGDQDEGLGVAQIARSMSVDEAKGILYKHKLKATWLNPPAASSRDRRRGKDKNAKQDGVAKSSLYPQPLQSFSELRARYKISARLASNIEEQGYSIPTEVQMGALPILLERPVTFLKTHASFRPQQSPSGIDLLTVAPTGSGKTLAYMIPLLHGICEARRTNKQRTASAIILAPTKELAGQIVNEGRKLSRDTGIKISQVRKGMKPAAATEHERPAGKFDTVVKSDVLVSTPGILANALQDLNNHENSSLLNVRYLILDEADVLLDLLFREQTLAIWHSLPDPDLRVSLWSATMGSNIEDLARSNIADRRMRIFKAHGRTESEGPLVRLVVGLKDSAVPNVKHRLVFAASEQGKLMGLRQILHPTITSNDAGPPLLPPFLVFTQTIERAMALHSELLYDIPAEAGGISRIAVLHSDLSDSARDNAMTRFRKGEIWVLITTDLLSRGVDFQGVNGVVNYDIPTSSAAYVHRTGRTGRAGREGGVAVTLYGKEDIPFLKPIVNLVAAAEKLKCTPDVEGVQSWLLSSLPSLSKNTKKSLKKHGVESRTTRGRQKDPKAARKARISTKAGFVRREENKRKGAILGSQHRQKIAVSGNEEETDFGGFD